MSPTDRTSDQRSDQSRDDAVAKVAELVGDAKLCMLTTTDADGALVSRPMGVQEAEFDGDLWFFTSGDARKVAHVRRDPRVGVTFSSRDTWVSLAGEAEVVRDVGTAEELWSTGLSAWFPEGPAAPGVVLLRVRARSAEYWDTPGAVTASLLSLVTARVTGRPAGVGENETVDL